jgi:O-antigen/teichoic acid export membrane protein
MVSHSTHDPSSRSGNTTHLGSQPLPSDPVDGSGMGSPVHAELGRAADWQDLSRRGLSLFARCHAAVARSKKLLVGTACISLQPMLLSALLLPATAYVIRGLGPTAYGEWATSTTLVAFVSFLTNIGLRGTFIREIARDPATAPDALADQLGLRIMLSAFAAILALAACLALGYSRTAFLCTLIACLGLILTTVATTAADMLQVLHRLPTIAAVNMLSGVLLTVASIVAVFRGAGPVIVALCYLIGPTVSAAVLSYVIGKHHFAIRARWNRRTSWKLLWEARFFAGQQLATSGSTYAEALIIPRLLGATAFGYFAAGSLLATRLTAVPDGIATVAYPAISNAANFGARPARLSFLKFLCLAVAVCVPIALSISVTAAPIAGVLFPHNAEVCRTLIAISIWLLPIMAVVWVSGAALNALHQDASQARASFTASALSIVVAAIMIWHFGVIGAAVSMVLKYVIYLALFAPLLRKALSCAGRGQSPSAGTPTPAAS